MPEGAAIGTAEDRAVPSILLFIGADIASFILFFAVFMGERLAQPVQFARSAAQLDARLGLANTLILVSSGWLVARAVRAGTQGNRHGARRQLFAALLVGSGFAVIKLVEYTADFQRGLTLLTNDFFSFYFALTGVHLLHYAIGMVLLGYVARMARTSTDPEFETWLTGVGLYWHMVDLLWLFLFPMFYLQGLW
ncbi:cytochrome c oxidase subunit 3 [Novosphingobium lentum]|uniref:cytochrome c oxidase subunit 3 n=1 Tax=Novosphingobium lentum TaxID=145287 RepID=UPI000831F30E|nr:cytochrome c oxidase subunit 3 [Novosphingobium lentum]